MKPHRRPLALFARLALLPFLLLALPAAGEAPPDPDDPELSGGARVEALIERVRYEQGRLKTLEADFVQRQESAMLLAPDVSRGTFSYAAPDSVRWEYAAPRPISVVIDGQEMLTWYRDLGRAERVKVGRYSDQVFKYLGASGSFDTLVEYFTVRARFPADAAEPYRLDLTPRFERIARRLKAMTVWVDRESYLPVRVRYESAEGDVTVYEFARMKVNRRLPGDRFELHLPAEVEVREVTLDRS